MSLMRLILWSTLIGGWSAFFGWLFSESALHLWIQRSAFVAILMATLVAIPIGGGICCASGLTNPNLALLFKRLGLGLAGGLLGGLLGSLVGSCIFGVLGLITTLGFVEFVGRVIGWTLIGTGIGVGIGVSEGIVDRSFNKLRNGLIGGVVGGFLGGLFFGLISLSGGSITSRAVSFVLLGLCIGLFIGLAQVILKEAWITVEAGFRPGRQMILGTDLITMGTSEKSSMIFIAFGAKGVEPTHLKIIKQEDGRYRLEDNQSRTGTLLNGQPITGPTALSDGDAIQFGVNVVRFNERVKHGGAKLPPAVVTAPAKPIPAGAVQAAVSVPTSAVQVAKPAPVAPPKPSSPAKPAPVPVQASEGRCPICDKKVVGIPGERRCGKCFTTF
jgi:FHA domain